MKFIKTKAVSYWNGKKWSKFKEDSSYIDIEKSYKIHKVYKEKEGIAIYVSNNFIKFDINVFIVDTDVSLEDLIHLFQDD